MRTFLIISRGTIVWSGLMSASVPMLVGLYDVGWPSIILSPILGVIIFAIAVSFDRSINILGILQEKPYYKNISKKVIKTYLKNSRDVFDDEAVAFMRNCDTRPFLKALCVIAIFNSLVSAAMTLNLLYFFATIFGVAIFYFIYLTLLDIFFPIIEMPDWLSDAVSK